MFRIEMLIFNGRLIRIEKYLYNDLVEHHSFQQITPHMRLQKEVVRVSSQQALDTVWRSLKCVDF